MHTDIISTRTVNLATVCAWFYFLCRDIKRAENETLRWADENHFPVPEHDGGGRISLTPPVTCRRH